MKDDPKNEPDPVEHDDSDADAFAVLSLLLIVALTIVYSLS